MMRTFEAYLIMVGIRSSDYTYTDEQLFDNIEYFRKCYQDHLSAYKALLFLHDYLEGNYILEIRKEVEKHDSGIFLTNGEYDPTKVPLGKPGPEGNVK